VLEVGIPYSDPLADGPTIQSASSRALSNGATVDASLRSITSAASQLNDTPVVVLAYYNTVLQRSFRTFAQQLSDSGVSGLLVPDAPLEEAFVLRDACDACNVELSLLVTPATPDERIQSLSSASRGFVYLVAVTGVTGARSEISIELPGVLKRVKNVNELPVAVGFGVSAPEHATQRAQRGAEGVIVGSALVKQLGESSSDHDGIEAMSSLAHSIHSGLP
jgi:tryptophan synthase alpha chain